MWGLGSEAININESRCHIVIIKLEGSRIKTNQRSPGWRGTLLFSGSGLIIIFIRVNISLSQLSRGPGPGISGEYYHRHRTMTTASWANRLADRGLRMIGWEQCEASFDSSLCMSACLLYSANPFMEMKFVKCKLLTESWALVHCNIYDPIIHSYWVLTIFAKWVKPSFHKYHWAPDTEQIVTPPARCVDTL